MKNEISDRVFSSILNFRDAGGLKTTDGGIMKKGLIYRSANPDKINGKDSNKLKMLKVKTIIDLRDPSEYSKRKVQIPGIKVLNLSLDLEVKPHQRLKPLIKRHFDPEEINREIRGLYLDIVDALKPILKITAELLLEPKSSPLLIHCQAGKDRTGILSAMLQMIAGVNKEEIISDFLASNDSLIPYFKKKLKLRKILMFGFFPSKAILHLLKQKEEDIVIAIDRIENHYEGINNYLSESGFDISQLNKLRNILKE